MLLHLAIDGDGTVEILLIPPASDVQRRYRHRMIQVRDGRLLLPELVVVGMCHVVIPRGDLALEHLSLHPRQRSQVEIPTVGVGAIEREAGVESLRMLHLVGVLEPVRQAERALMMKVVAQPHVGRRGLRRRRLERRMRIHQRLHHQPPVVRHAQHADATVVVGHALGQPLHRVPRVSPFVDRLGVAPVPRRALHHELSFALVLAADLLERNGVTVTCEFAHGGSRSGEAGSAGAVDTIGRSPEDDREQAGVALWHPNGGVQAHAITHRDH